MYHTIIAVDVEKFSQRDAAHQRRIHEALQPLVREAVEHCGLAWDECHHEDRGDGLLVLAPSAARGERLAECLPNELAGRLREYNHGAASGARIRLRVVVHAGDVARDAQGVAGPAVVLAFRLLDSEELRQALARSHGLLALITSAEFFQNVIAGHPAANPAVYRPVHVSNRGTETTGWISLPDNHPHRGHARSVGPPVPAGRVRPDLWWAVLGVVAAAASAAALWGSGWYLPHALVAGLVAGALGVLTATAVTRLTTRSGAEEERAG
ncbi:hypothetical protein [Actinophytocola sp. KF-1]